MIEIIKILMDFGMDFEYENNGSLGEKIVSFELGLEISNQNGKVYFSCACAPENFSESESLYKILALKVKEECVAQTASF